MTDQPSQQQSQSSNSNQDQAFSIPEQYADRGWAEKIKSPDDLWKTLDNTQSLLGKRPAGIPSPDAPDTEWDKFYAASGRPESPDKYKFSDIDGIPKETDLTPFKQKAATILHAAGLSNKQADRVWKQYIQEELKAVSDAQKNNQTKQAELDAEFDKLTKEHFGEKYDAASAAAQELLKTSVPDQLKGVIADASPKQQVAIIAALSAAKNEIDSIKKKYGAEGSTTSGGQVSSGSIEDTRKELATLRTSAAAKDFMHKDHKQTMERINALAGVVAAHYKK